MDSWHNEQRAVQVVLLCLTAMAFSLMVVAAPGAYILSTRGAFLIAAFLSLGVISAAFAHRPLAALAEVSLFALLFALAAMTAVVVNWDKERAVRWAQYIALFLATAYVSGVLVRLAAALEIGHGVDLNVLLLGYANPRFPTAFHTVLVPFVAAVAISRAEPLFLRIGAVAVLALLWATNWGLGTRGIWFAYLVAVPAAIALLGWHNLKRLSALLLVTAIGGVALFVALASLTGPGIEPLSAPTQNLSLTSRDVLWGLARDAIMSAPLLGIGPMHFVNYGSYVGSHPHNWLLQVAAEWGLVATSVLIFPLALTGRAIRTHRAVENIQAPIVALIASLALGFVDGNLVMPVSQTAFFLVVGLAFALLTKQSLPSQEQRSASTAVVVCAVVTTAACVLPLFARQSLGAQAVEVARFKASHPSAWLVPRFWEQGSLQ
jgi:O-antigen ligase